MGGGLNFCVFNFWGIICVAILGLLLISVFLIFGVLFV